MLAQTAAAFTRAGFADPTLVLRWPEIAGHDVARLAQPVKLQHGENGLVLTLRCDPGASVFLQHQTRALMERLNAYLGVGRIVRLKLVPGTPPEATELTAHPAGRAVRNASPNVDSGEKPTLSHALERLDRLRKQSRKSTGASRAD